MRHFNFNHLHYFFAIAKHGSIVKASRALHLTQSTLSDQLRQFEESLGVKLFERAHRKLELNAYGRIAFEYASRIFALCEELERRLRGRERGEARRLRIGVIPSLEVNHVQELTFQLLRHSEFSVSLRQGTLDDLHRELDRAELDLILSDIALPSRRAPLKAVRLAPRRLEALAPPSLATLASDFPRSVMEAPFIQFTNHSQIRHEIEHYFRGQEVKLRPVAEVDSPELARVLAEEGMGFTVLPERIAEVSLQSGRLIRLGSLDGVQSDVWALIHAHSPHHERVLEALTLPAPAEAA